MAQSEAASLGLVQEQTLWYDKPDAWPALRHGYNTGVMLMDLKRLKNTWEWAGLWRRVVKEELERFKSVKLADQDVINSIIKRNPKIVYSLPCGWNLQLTDVPATDCYDIARQTSYIAHFNGEKIEMLKKLNQLRKEVKGFRKQYLEISRYNDDLLKTKAIQVPDYCH